MDSSWLLREYGPFGSAVLVIVIVFLCVWIYEKFMGIRYEKHRIFYDLGRKIDREERNENNGYVVIDVPQELKSIVHEYLLGFEEYAKLKGHKITVSVDNSIDGKMAIKLVINNQEGFYTSQDTIKKDFKEYFKNIKDKKTFQETKNTVKETGSEDQIRALEIFSAKRDFLHKAMKNVKKDLSFIQNRFISVNIIANNLSVGDTSVSHKENSDNYLVGGGIAIGTKSAATTRDVLVNSSKSSINEQEAIKKALDVINSLLISSELKPEDAKPLNSAKANLELSEETLNCEGSSSPLFQKYLDNASGALKSIKDMSSYGKTAATNISEIQESLLSLIN